MTPRERADRAAKLLEDELLTQAFADIRMGLVDRLEHTPFGDVETQHEVALMLQLLRQVRTKLEQYCNDAKMIEAQVKQDRFIEKMRQKVGI